MTVKGDSRKVRLVEISQAPDFKAAVMKALGDLSDYSVLAGNVLLATYVRPKVTTGGIIIPEKTQDEDRWQGTVGMVLKLGDGAFKYDGPYAYEGPVPKVGQYVMFHTSDTRELFINGISCRLIQSELIRIIVPDPKAIY